MDSTQMIMETAKDCKSLLARLNKVVTSSDQKHMQIFDKSPFETEVFEGIPLNLKIKLKDAAPPLTLQFTYQSEKSKNIDVFVS